MIVKGIIDEDFVNYKKPSMTIEFPYCSFKCDKDCGQQVCQNSALVHTPNIDIPVYKLIERYINNPITHAIVFQGLEPFDSYYDLWDFIYTLRVFYSNYDDIVIYTGYTKEELKQMTIETGLGTKNIIEHLKYKNGNIIIKFGRFIPNQPSHFDDILGVTLASPNQYAERI